MGVILKKLQTNFNGGVASPFIEGRPDVAKYFNMLLQGDNVLILPEGGFTRRYGTRWIKSAKNDGQAVLAPFIPAIETAYVVEFGNLYIRIHRRDGTQAAEIVSPYATADLEHISADAGNRQSVDVLYIDHPSYQPRKLNRISDTSWSLTLADLDPPPSFEADTDISETTETLTPGATTGTGVTFTCSAAKFLKGDVGRQIIFGASRAVITQLGPSAGAPSPNTIVIADILDDFPDTNPIAAGSWLLRRSAQTTLDVDKKEPVGASVALAFGVDSLRAADVGKFLKLYGGVIEITARTSGTAGTGIILSVLSDSTNANPAAAPAGSWTMEVAMWSDARGWPSANEFHEGRLFHSGSDSDPTTVVGSQSNNYENYAIGSLATDAVQYTHASGEFDKMRWLASLQSLFFGTGRREVRMRGPGVDEPLGGDVVPDVKDQTAKGSVAIRPIVVGDSILFVNWTRKKVFAMRYAIETDKFRANNANVLSRTLTEHQDFTISQGLKLHRIAYAQEPFSIAFFIRNDGIVLALTHEDEQEILGWSVLNYGNVESMCVVPHSDGDRHQIWMIVKRTINAVTKRYIEVVEDGGHDRTLSKWAEFNTDAAIKITKSDTASQSTLTGLSHLAGATVDLWMYRTDLASAQSPSYLGQFVVSAAGVLTLNNPVDFTCIFEVGLPYRIAVKSMRPSVEGQMVEGHLRKWIKLFLRLHNSIPPKVNGEQMDLAVGGDPMDQGVQLVKGDREVYSENWVSDLDGYITIEQDVPGPLTVLSMFGEVEFSERMQ